MPNCYVCKGTDNLTKAGKQGTTQKYRCQTCNRRSKASNGIQVIYEKSPEYQEWVQKSRESMQRILARHG